MQKIKQEVEFETLIGIIEEKLRMGGEVNILATGNSMYPLFRHKEDQVCLRKAEPDQLKKYDMVLYRRTKGKYVLHRIVGSGEEGYILRGDGQIRDEYPVKPEQIIARVESFCRNGKIVTCEDIRYRFYAPVWVHTVFLRRMSERGKNYLRRIRNGIRRKLNRS